MGFGRSPRAKADGATPDHEGERLLIVGGGMSAQRLVEALVTRGGVERYDITLLGEELSPPYDRVHLAHVVEQDPGSVVFRDPEWYAATGITLRLKERVAAVDRAQRIVRTETGATLAYDRLVFATGGRPFVPPIPGRDLPGTTTYRTIEDAERIGRVARDANQAIVVGGGLLGLEVARSIRRAGCRVEIVEMSARLLPRQLDVAGADVLARAVRRLELDLTLLTRVVALEEQDDRLRVSLSDGTSRESDLVVFAIGIRPEDTLAREAGLECHPGGGIVVDDALATSDPAIAAIGECVRHRDATYGFVAPCYEMAETLADRLVGGARRFEGAPVSARLKIPEIEMSSVGEALAEGPTVRDLCWVEPGEYRRLVLRDGRLVGAICVGPSPERSRLQEAVARGARIGARHERRFAKTGRLWRDGGEPPIAEWPDAAVVCSCTGVTCGALRAAWNEGCHSRETLREATGASSGCGSCAPLLAELVGETPAGRRRAAGRSLGLAALLGLGAIAIAWALGPIPMSTSVRDVPSIDFLWRDGFWKQVSGFGLVAVMALALALPLRERLPLMRGVGFAAARRAHAWIGLLAVGLAGLHSGLRLGANLNLLLMASVVGLLAIGSMAALVTSLEHRLPHRAGHALRTGWRRAHVLVAWPVPVLLFFHVLAVYLY